MSADHRFTVVDGPHAPDESAASAPPRAHPKGERAQDRLTAMLQAIQRDAAQPRDPITKLLATQALECVLEALPPIKSPIGLVVIALWSASGTGSLQDAAVQAATLRVAAAALRANVRQGDLICRLTGMDFAVVMPHLTERTRDNAIRRLRLAMEDLPRTIGPGRRGLAVAMGSGFWQPGLPIIHPLERAWQAMLAERTGAMQRQRQAAIG